MGNKVWSLSLLAAALLIISFSLVHALAISNVKAESVTSSSAVIIWKTDEDADSFVSYSTDKINWQKKGDADLLTEHTLTISGIKSETEYFFSVESNSQVDNNSGTYYSFTTPAPDLTPPKLEVTIPGLNAGTELTLEGQSEPNARIEISVNKVLALKTTVSDPEGNFNISGIILESNKQNDVLVKATDSSGNEVSVSGTVLADLIKPRLEKEEFPELVSDNLMQFNIPLSEESSYEIFVNDKSAAKGEGATLEAKITLQEGDNNIRIVLTDKAGWQTEKEFKVLADTKAAFVKAEIARGREYYQGREQSDISGETKPGAKVYLYVYRPQSYEYKPDFKKAREEVVADNNGSFVFNDVNFAQEITDIRLKDLAPKEVPSGLLEVSIFPIQEVTQQEQFTYYIYIISEDKTGKTAYWQQTVTVNSCFSGNLDFSIVSVPEFQQPFRLFPSLMDEGRQEIQALFRLTYNGAGVPQLDAAGQAVEPGFKVNNIIIEKACTQSMLKDESVGLSNTIIPSGTLGCKIIPGGNAKLITNNDKTSAYATWKLLSAGEISKSKGNFWDQFSKSQIVFPVKITVDYQERTHGQDQEWTNKRQTLCSDLSYYVDVPVESKDLIPDFLAKDVLSVANDTLEALGEITPVVEQAYLIAGYTCTGSWVLSTISRGYREVISTLEAYFDTIKPKKSGINKDENRGCPLPDKQESLYPRETINYWLSLSDPVSAQVPKTVLAAAGDPVKLSAITLEDRCPKTAAAWKFEETINSLLKWSCDRALCRAVPAGWTADQDMNKITEVMEEESSCGVTGRGVVMQKIENCRNFVEKNNQIKVNLPSNINVQDLDICYRNNNQLYVYDESKQDQSYKEKNVYRLTPVAPLFGQIGEQKTLLAYKQPGSEDYMVARDSTCSNVCGQKKGYKAADDGYPSTGLGGVQTKTVTEQITVKNPDGSTTTRTETKTLPISNQGNSCYLLKKDDSGNEYLESKTSNKLKPGETYSAGYTNDCFIDDSSGEAQLKQCVCQGQETTEYEVKPNKDFSLRNAQAGEEWFYQQERVFKESGGKKGTNYPTIRYYSGRDFSSAFGADYLLDYVTGKKTTAKVDPHTQTITGPIQTVCLSQILKNLKMIEAFVTGFRNCIEEAKYTGLHDSGMCKTWFTQEMCGLIYKSVAALNTQCSPTNFDDVNKDSPFADIGVVLSEGSKGLTRGLQSSIDDMKEEYGNAKFNEYFQAGAQGFSQSICLAAFGYDFPLFDKNFLLDAAYSAPMKTSLLVAPALREFSSYDPTKQTAVYNYQIGAQTFPGCRIKSYSLKLKCIGPEDLGNYGVDATCNGQGCDCINAQASSVAVESQRIYNIKNGINLPINKLTDFQIPSPLLVNSPFRYDHIVVEMNLDPLESGNADKCFDSAAIQGNKAAYYYPLKDVSLPGQIGCNVDAVSGRFVCSALAAEFGFGGTYLEDPFVTCWNKETQSWSSCTADDLFLLNDEMKLKVYLNSDGKGQCLKRTITPANIPGLMSEYVRQLPEGINGPSQIEENLGVVTQSLFGGSYASLILQDSQSNPGCNPNPSFTGSLPTTAQQLSYNFVFEPVGGNQLRLNLPSDVSVLDANYERSGNYLKKKSGGIELTLDEVNNVVFGIQGFQVKNVFGQAQLGVSPNQCSYQVQSTSAYAAEQNFRTFQVTYELLEKNQFGTCSGATQRVKASLGRPVFTATIKVQKQKTVFQKSGGIHEAFMTGNYDTAILFALEILQKESNDFDNILAVYYSAASWLMKGQKEGSLTAYGSKIADMFNLFFQRIWQQTVLRDYDSATKNTVEFGKILTYFCQIDKLFGSPHQASCAGIPKPPVGGTVNTGGASAANPSPSTSTNYQRAKKLYQDLKSKIDNDNLVRGMVANAWAESGAFAERAGDCHDETYKNAIYISSKKQYCCSHGLWQYNICGGRGSAYLNEYGKESSSDADKLNLLHNYGTQIDFMVDLLNEKYSSEIAKDKTAADWTYWFTVTIESPKYEKQKGQERQALLGELEQKGVFD